MAQPYAAGCCESTHLCVDVSKMERSMLLPLSCVKPPRVVRLTRSYAMSCGRAQKRSFGQVLKQDMQETLCSTGWHAKITPRTGLPRSRPGREISFLVLTYEASEKCGLPLWFETVQRYPVNLGLDKVACLSASGLQDLHKVSRCGCMHTPLYFMGTV